MAPPRRCWSGSRTLVIPCTVRPVIHMTRCVLAFVLLLVLGCEPGSRDRLDGEVDPQLEPDGAGDVAQDCEGPDASCDAQPQRGDTGATDARAGSDAPSAEASTFSSDAAAARDAQGLDAQGLDAQALDAQTLDAASLDGAALTDGHSPEAAAPDAQLPEAGVPHAAEWRGTLITWLGRDESSFVSRPHQIELISAESGLRFEPPVTATNGTAGKFRLQVPDSRPHWVHVVGQGPVTDSMSTYDSLTLWVPASGDQLVRIATLGTAATAETTGWFTARPDHVSVQGAVYRVDATGRRVGRIGCAKIFLDNLPSPALSADQRYIDGVLPTPLDRRSRTQRTGQWYFGNVAPGQHTFKASVDDGQSFLGQTTVYVPMARKDASGPFKHVAVILDIDVPGPDPTPVSCPAD
jgi:hypothetical protein